MLKDKFISFTKYLQRIVEIKCRKHDCGYILILVDIKDDQTIMCSSNNDIFKIVEMLNLHINLSTTDSDGKYSAFDINTN